MVLNSAASSCAQVQGSLAAGSSRPGPALIWQWVAPGSTGKPEGSTVEARVSAHAQEGSAGAQLPEAGAQRGGRCAQWSWPACQTPAVRHEVRHGQAARCRQSHKAGVHRGPGPDADRVSPGGAQSNCQVPLVSQLRCQGDGASLLRKHLLLSSLWCCQRLAGRRGTRRTCNTGLRHPPLLH